MYGRYALTFPTEAKVIGVCEPLTKRRTAFAESHKILPENIHTTYTEIKTRIADAAIIAVQDSLHASVTTHLASLGYHILCEKPMATTLSDCLEMKTAIQKANVIFAIGHVLRYSPYTQAIKKVLDSNEIGRIINIVHVEPVGWYHFAHSYVRGNWNQSHKSSFSLMTKSCHDIDILTHYFHPLKPVSVSSFGSLSHFKRDQKPIEAGTAKACSECKLESSCPYSATQIYVKEAQNGNRGWPISVVCGEDIEDLSFTATNNNNTKALVDLVKKKLSTGPYGKCVYESENDVCDHQVVNIQFETGVTASFTMVAFTEVVCQRQTRIHGTHGEIVGDMRTFTVYDFGKRTGRRVDPSLEMNSGHGGGDWGIMRSFLKGVAAKDQSLIGCTVEEVFTSHALVFAAEEARLKNKVVDFAEFVK
ncbi:hypothetical protein HDU76_012959 [Blyttiomyces sp. JEL0837]|nr:hypothetical protein HDU76_012959 [Blyttiomyces sp. JEL0837]